MENENISQQNLLPVHSTPFRSTESITSSRKTSITSISARTSSEPFSEKDLSSPNYPPQDGGTAAWTFLFGASILETVTWGFPQSFGVFREYYFDNPPFQGISILAVTGLLSDGCLQLSMPFLMLLLKRFPHWYKRMMWIGLLFCIAGCIGAAFATQAWQVIATQGALYGIGAGLLQAPVIVLMDDWFDKRQSFAYGVMFGSSGIPGSFMPIVYSKLLGAFGRRITLLSYAGGASALILASLICIEPRVPIEKPAPKTQRISATTSSPYHFWRGICFWLLAGSVVFQAAALNLPAIYLPNYVLDLKYSSTHGAVALSMFNLATACGQIGFGYWADHRSSFHSSVMISTLFSGLASALYWGEAKTVVASTVFALLYGASSGGFGILRSRFAASVVDDKNDRQQVLFVFGIFTAIRGTGNLGGGVIGQKLVKEKVPVEWRAYGLKKWDWLILFVASAMLVACVCGGLEHLYRTLQKKRAAKEESSHPWPKKHDTMERLV